jgi:serpin B
MRIPLRPLLLLVFLPAASFARDYNFATATNQTGLDLFQQLASTRSGENLAISPYSIVSAFTLAYVGSAANTRDELARVLHFPSHDSELPSDLAALQKALFASTLPRPLHAGNAPDVTAPGAKIELYSASRLFGQRGYDFRSSFLQRLKNDFDAPFESLNFHSESEKARQHINAWIADRTKNKISHLIPSGTLGAQTKLLLINALYLKAPWDKPFDGYQTKPRQFHVRGGTETRLVETMARTGSLGYSREKNVTVVALDYRGGDFQCVLLLPDEGHTVDEIAAQLTPKRFSQWRRVSEKNSRLIELQFPKIRLEGETLSLRDALKALGVKSAFDDPTGSANFDAIAPRRPDDYLALSDVLHKTFIAIDEDGTEAAAATTIQLVSFGIIAGPRPQPLQVHLDRPFLLAIQHKPSGVCLFLARINDPN